MQGKVAFVGMLGRGCSCVERCAWFCNKADLSALMAASLKRAENCKEVFPVRQVLGLPLIERSHSRTFLPGQWWVEPCGLTSLG